MRHIRSAVFILSLLPLGVACSSPSGGSGSGSNGSGADGAGGGTGGTFMFTGSGGANGVAANGGGGMGFGGNTGSNTGFFGEGCNEETYTGERLPMDIYIMFDQSLSMTCATPSGATRWDDVVGAMRAFLNDPSATGLGVGIQYFGNGDINQGQQSSCDPLAYEMPDVEIAPLPGNAQPMIDSLMRHYPMSVTPTPPALAGALNHAIAFRNQSGRPAVTLLVTDGQPNACGSLPPPNPWDPPGATPQDVATIAAAGLSGAGMSTYVLGIVGDGAGVCGLDPNVPNVADLNLVAQSGGTNVAFIVDASLGASQGVADQFVQKMNEIRTSAQLPCEFALPVGSDVDTSKVNLTYTPPASMQPEPVYNAANPGLCDPATGGWHYDDTQTRIILCPVTCDVVKAQQGGQVRVVLGCPTKPIE